MYNRYFRAPLAFNSQKFFRGYKKEQKYKISPLWVATIIKIVYVFLLIAIDLVLFTGSGSLAIFQKGFILTTELNGILGIIFLISVVLMLVSAFNEKVQNVICAIVTFWFIVVLFNQFAQFDRGAFLGEYLAGYVGRSIPSFLFTQSHIILALLLSSAVLWFLFKAGIKLLAVYTLLFVFAFAGILRNEYNNSRDHHDFIELYQSQIKNNAQTHDKKFLYIMLPNLVSPKVMPLMDGKDAGQIAAGFLAKNNFAVFSNAFTAKEMPFINMVSSFNVFSQEPPTSHILDTMLLYKYWKFFNINDEYIFLKNNQMFDTFRKSGYKISAYKSHGFDLCHKQHMFNVDRCIEKLNHPINFYSMNVTPSDRMQLLLVEWLTSMKIFRNMSGFYQAAKIFSDMESVPLVGINYNNLYVVNSVKTFDLLLENMKQDKGRQAYFVYADLPSDMYIYDEFCSIKPRHEWINMDNLPWINVDNTTAKKQAYFEQTKCLFGKLQWLVEKLSQEDLLSKTVIVLNGMSSVNNFRSVPYADFSDDLIYGRLITLAILSPSAHKPVFDNQLCESNQIIRHYLYKDKSCDGLTDINIHQSLRDDLNEKLQQSDFTPEMIEEAVTVFDQWYQKWSRMNNLNTNDPSEIDIIRKEQLKNKLVPLSSGDSGHEPPDLENELR